MCKIFCLFNHFLPKKAYRTKAEKNDIFGILIQVLRPVWEFEVDTSKKVEHSLNPPKHSATLAFCQKFPRYLAGAKWGNSLGFSASLEESHEFRGAPTRRRLFFFLFREVDSKTPS